MEEDTQQKSAEYMRLAIPLMTKYGITMTPESYAVWYEYVSGGNMQLSETIDMDIAEHGSFTNQRTQELYERFLRPEKSEPNLHEQKNGLRRVLAEILKYAKTGANAASACTNQLAEALAKLHPDMTRAQIHDVIVEVMKETEQAISSSQVLTDKLNAAVADIEALKLDMEDTKKQAKIDRLTGLANRKAFDDYIQTIVKEAERSDQVLSVIFCDLDHFRELNAVHGHLVGDQVLKIVADILKSQLKGRDFVARYGGEEFTITLINTSIEDATMLAESIREEVASKKIQRKDNKASLGQITMSFGIAAYWQTEGVDSFLQRADRALYHAKRKGRNNTSEAHPPII